MVRAAFRIATSGRPGPVAIIVPHDVIDAEWAGDPTSTAADERYTRAPAYRPVASDDSVEAALALLRKARRPIIVAGGGVHASRATAEVAMLAERLDAVVVTSLSGKGAVDETGPRAAGVLNPLGTSESLELVRKADLVFWCGSKVGQNTSHNWTIPFANQVTIHLDADAIELGRTFRPTVALNGDAQTTLGAMLRSLPAKPRPSWRAEVARAKKHAASQRSEAEGSDAVPILPQRVMHDLASHLQASDVVISDASFSAGWIAAHIPARLAGRGFLFARGQGGLGYAVPAAIGAAVARPESRVVTVSGDGGFSYCIGELATHAQHGLRTINIVLNNGSLSWLAMYQHLFFDGLRQSVDLEGERLSPDFAAVAEGLGCKGIRVERPHDLAGALDVAFAATKPVVVDVRTEQKVTPIHSYTRRLSEGRHFPRPGTVYELVEWRRSPEDPPADS
jgi:acetolactate synthase-1/2/3 large subunit